MIHPNELTQMLLDAGFPYSMDTLHNMDKFQKLVGMAKELGMQQERALWEMSRIGQEIEDSNV